MTKKTNIYQSSQQDMDLEDLGIHDHHRDLWEHYLLSAPPQSWGCFQMDRGAAGPHEHRLVEGNDITSVLIIYTV